MNIDVKTAVNTLQSVDHQLKSQIKSFGATPPGRQSDQVEISGRGLALSKGIASEGIQKLYAELDEQLSSLTDLIGSSAGRQKGLAADAKNGVSPEVQAKAQELLDGYFNVENTAGRIFDFAFSFYDGSSDREAYAKEFRGYIEEGFRQAEKQLGGLADISLQTRDLIDEKVNDFINEGKEEQEAAE